MRILFALFLAIAPALCAVVVVVEKAINVNAN